MLILQQITQLNLGLSDMELIQLAWQLGYNLEIDSQIVLNNWLTSNSVFALDIAILVSDCKSLMTYD